MLVKKLLKKLGYLSMIGLFVVNFLVLSTNETKAAACACTYIGQSLYKDGNSCMIVETWDCEEYGTFRFPTGETIDC